MIVTATEFKNNLGKYIDRANEEDIIITKNGRSVATLTNARNAQLNALRSMRGILKGMDTSKEAIHAERRARYFENEAVD